MLHEDICHLAMAHAPEAHATVLAALNRLDGRYHQQFCTVLRLLVALRRGAYQTPPSRTETRTETNCQLTQKGKPNMRTLTEYTIHDVAPEDQPACAKHVDQWQTELHPNGALECWCAAEIVRATWPAVSAISSLFPLIKPSRSLCWPRFRAAALAVIAALAMHLAVIALDLQSDATDHNLFPLELLIVAFSASPAFLGAALAQFTDTARKRMGPPPA